MTTRMRPAYTVAIVGVTLTVLVAGGYRYTYPFGFRPAILPSMATALRAYASEHHGRFPNGGGSFYSALQKLYPEYVPSGIELAGVSGNVKSAVRALREAKTLNAANCSWVYMQGFSEEDDHRIAILWESRPGLYPNGRRNSEGARAVLLIGGTITNVTEIEWQRFLDEQGRLRRNGFVRTNQTTRSPNK